MGEAVDEGCIERQTFLRRGVLGWGQREQAAHDTPWVKSGADVVKTGQTAQKQAGSNEQYQREGNLADDQAGTEALAAHAGYTPTPAFSETMKASQTQHLAGRRQTEQDRRDGGCEQGDDDDTRVEPHFERHSRVVGSEPQQRTGSSTVHR